MELTTRTVEVGLAPPAAHTQPEPHRLQKLFLPLGRIGVGMRRDDFPAGLSPAEAYETARNAFHILSDLPQTSGSVVF